MPALRLHNHERVDAIPALLLPVRRIEQARDLRRARLILRRKEDGRYLAALLRRGRQHHLQPLHGDVCRQRADIDALLDRLGLRRAAPLHPQRATPLDPRSAPTSPRANGGHGMTTLGARLAALGIDATVYREQTGLAYFWEPSTLAYAGRDRYRRPLWLADGAMQAYRRLVAAAAAEGIRIEAISGFRSHAYQHGIFRRKLARGKPLEQILRENAAPGFSEHHSGRAIDFGTPGEPPAEESFENTAAFAWLQRHARTFGFQMSYPRDNPHGILYEPWHWCWQP